MRKFEKFVIAVLIIDVVLIAFMIGYYYGHYMNHHIVIRYVPYCKHIKLKWV